MKNINILGIDISGEKYAIVAERDDLRSILYSGWIRIDAINYNDVVKVCTLNTTLSVEKNHIFDIRTVISVLKSDMPVITSDLCLDVEEEVDCDDCLSLGLEVSFKGTECGYGAMLEYSNLNTRKEWVSSHLVDLAQDLRICIDKFEENNELFKLNRNKSLTGVSYVIAGKLEKNLVDNLKTLVEKYDIVEWGEYKFSVPVMYFLKNASLNTKKYKSLNDKEFYREYGLDENPVFRFPLLDHVFCFKDRKGRGYIVSNPYMSDGEIVQYMDCLNTESSSYGDYSGIRYKICGKGSSIYSSDVNMVVFSYGE